MEGWGPFHEKLLQNIPAYQVVHSAGIVSSPSMGSLATIVVPPFWNDHQKNQYPVLFNGSYDIHQTFASYFSNSVKAVEPIRTQKSSAGTHDPNIPYEQQLDYAEKIFNLGIPTSFRLAYRFGHCGGIDDADFGYFATVRKAFASVILKQKTHFPKGIALYRRRNETHFDEPIQFQTVELPAFVIVPNLMTRDNALSVVFAALPGTHAELRISKIDEPAWNMNKEIKKLNSGGHVIAVDMKSPFRTFHQAVVTQTDSWTKNADVGTYTYEFWIKERQTGTWQQILPTPRTGDATQSPVFKVLAETPQLKSIEFYLKYTAGDRANFRAFTC